MTPLHLDVRGCRSRAELETCLRSWFAQLEIDRPDLGVIDVETAIIHLWAAIDAARDESLAIRPSVSGLVH